MQAISCRRFVYLATAISALGGVFSGYDIVVISGAILSLTGGTGIDLFATQIPPVVG